MSHRRGLSAWETKQACEHALAEKLQSDRAPSSGKGEVTVDTLSGKPRMIWRRSTTTGVLITAYTYACLPDTVDPHGPKGK
jgi:hypothetical protein